MKTVALLSAVLILQACAAAPTVMEYFPEGESPNEVIVWPPAPEIARLEYVGVLIGEINFTVADDAQEGIGMRILRWIAGLGGMQREIRQLLRPQTGTVDSGGRILISDVGRQAVFVFDESQGELFIWVDAGSARSFQSPVGIGVRPDGYVLVADAELGYVVVLAPDGTPVDRIGDGTLSRPTGLTIDSASGDIYVSDTAAHDIKVFNRDGELLRTIGRRGTGPGEFNSPTHLRFDDGRLYVTDTLNARIQILTASGEATAEMGKRGLFVGNLVRPKGVTTDSDGNIYVVESYYDHLLVFDTNGNLLLPIGGAGNRVGQFFLPAGIWSDSADRIFVADMFNGRVIVLRYLGG